MYPIPIIIYMALLMLSLGMHAANHGRNRKGKHNGWTGLIAILIHIGLLWWAGVFDNLNFK